MKSVKESRDYSRLKNIDYKPQEKKSVADLHKVSQTDKPDSWIFSNLDGVKNYKVNLK